jgi:hypothetical protein
MKISKIGFINEDYSVKALHLSTALESSSAITKEVSSNTKYIAIKSAITDNLLEGLLGILKKHKQITILAEDATKLFISPTTLKKFEKKGGCIKVLNPINVIAITINPTSPLGYEFNKIKFLNLLKKKIDLPIYNLGLCD